MVQRQELYCPPATAPDARCFCAMSPRMSQPCHEHPATLDSICHLATGGGRAAWACRAFMDMGHSSRLVVHLPFLPQHRNRTCLKSRTAIMLLQSRMLKGSLSGGHGCRGKTSSIQQAAFLLMQLLEDEGDPGSNPVATAAAPTQQWRSSGGADGDSADSDGDGSQGPFWSSPLFIQVCPLPWLRPHQHLARQFVKAVFS